jgi:hypothetical protein
MQRLFSVIWGKPASEGEDMDPNAGRRKVNTEKCNAKDAEPEQDANLADIDSSIETARRMLDVLNAKRLEVDNQSRAIRCDLAKAQAQLALLTQERNLLLVRLRQKTQKHTAEPRPPRFTSINKETPQITDAESNCEAEENVKDPGALALNKSATARATLPGAPQIFGREITSETVKFADDGVAYTDPPLLRGVPLAKISPNHPYWDAAWPDLELSIRCRHGDPVDQPLEEALEFLRDCDIHPYQLVGKAWVKPEDLIDGGVMVAFSRAMKELQEFDLDVTPLQWLRQRLHEIYRCFPKFNLSLALAGLESDPKMAALREKRYCNNPGKGQPLQQRRKIPSLRRLKIPQGCTNSAAAPRSESLYHDGGTSSQQPVPQEPPRKRRRLERTPSDAGFGSGGYTSSDSSTGDKVHPTDWRISQIKTAYATADGSVRQYWHWVEEDGVLEHQVLQRVGHVSGRRAYRDPVDFHLRVAEVSDVYYADDSPKVVIEKMRRRITRAGARARVRMVVSFRRERTKQRFLRFMSTKGVGINKTTV